MLRNEIESHDIKTLTLFVACCELQNVSKAAAHLNMAVSAASRRIRMLENSVKIPLLSRRPHGVEPTAAGLTVLHYARDVLRLTHQMEGLITEHRSGIRGYVRISSSSSVLIGRLAADLSIFANKEPDIKVDLEERPTHETLDSLLTKRVDIGAIVGGTERGRIETFPYGGDRLCVAVHARHPLAERAQVSFSDIARYDLITLDHSTALRRLLADRARVLGTYLNVRVQVTSFQVMGLMVSKGIGIGILPESTISAVADSWALRLIELNEPWARRGFMLCVRSSEALDRPATRLLRFLIDQGAALSCADQPVVA
ncbi:MAG: LysR family transcriptional regulator [Variibacter sp.]